MKHFDKTEKLKTILVGISKMFQHLLHMVMISSQSKQNEYEYKYKLRIIKGH